MSPSNPSQESVAEWVAAMAAANISFPERILRNLRERTQAAHEAKDINLLPTAAEISDAIGVSVTSVRDNLLRLESESLVVRIGGKHARWASAS